jgi:hypothetical protein
LVDESYWHVFGHYCAVPIIPPPVKNNLFKKLLVKLSDPVVN